MSEKELPEFLQKVIKRYPSVWQAYGNLSKEVKNVGALDEKTSNLVKLALSVGAKSEGAVHSYTRRCKKAGISDEEIYQVALLAITSLGWSSAMAALSWMNDCLKSL